MIFKRIVSLVLVGAILFQAQGAFADDQKIRIKLFSNRDGENKYLDIEFHPYSFESQDLSIVKKSERAKALKKLDDYYSPIQQGDLKVSFTKKALKLFLLMQARKGLEKASLDFSSIEKLKKTIHVQAGMRERRTIDHFEVARVLLEDTLKLKPKNPLELNLQTLDLGEFLNIDSQVSIKSYNGFLDSVAQTLMRIKTKEHRLNHLNEKITNESKDFSVKASNLFLISQYPKQSRFTNQVLLVLVLTQLVSNFPMAKFNTYQEIKDTVRNFTYNLKPEDLTISIAGMIPKKYFWEEQNRREESLKFENFIKSISPSIFSYYQQVLFALLMSCKRTYDVYEFSKENIKKTDNIDWNPSQSSKLATIKTYLEARLEKNLSELEEVITAGEWYAAFPQAGVSIFKNHHYSRGGGYSYKAEDYDFITRYYYKYPAKYRVCQVQKLKQNANEKNTTITPLYVLDEDLDNPKFCKPYVIPGFIEAGQYAGLSASMEDVMQYDNSMHTILGFREAPLVVALAFVGFGAAARVFRLFVGAQRVLTSESLVNGMVGLRSLRSTIHTIKVIRSAALTEPMIAGGYRYAVDPLWKKLLALEFALGSYPAAMGHEAGVEIVNGFNSTMNPSEINDDNKKYSASWFDRWLYNLGVKYLSRNYWGPGMHYTDLYYFTPLVLGLQDATQKNHGKVYMGDVGMDDFLDRIKLAFKVHANYIKKEKISIDTIETIGEKSSLGHQFLVNMRKDPIFDRMDSNTLESYGAKTDLSDTYQLTYYPPEVLFQNWKYLWSEPKDYDSQFDH